MRSVVRVHKKRGETPLQALEAWRAANPSLAHLPATYAGRLDPMAEGLLVLLVGEACKEKEWYVGMDKEYVVEVVLGVGTDTGDTLGMPVLGTEVRDVTNSAKVVRGLVGSATLPYPPFSSKTVRGKPLFQYALEGTLDTITIPKHSETIHRMTLVGVRMVSTEELLARIATDLAVVPRSAAESKRLGHDFRQDAIRHAWEGLHGVERVWPVLRLRVVCGSGTYMRTLAERLGSGFDTRGCALSINRTRIGRYHQWRWLGWWT
jgi:tRNA pseudouridine(55) synthase